MVEKRRLSRRNFLRLGVVSVGGAALVACSPQVAPTSAPLQSEEEKVEPTEAKAPTEEPAVEQPAAEQPAAPEPTAVPEQATGLPRDRQVHYNLQDYEGLTGKKLEFKQSPILDGDVSSGKLPLLEDRLPAEPLVVVPFSEVGVYGGSVIINALEPRSWWPASQGTTEYFFTRDMRYPDVLLPAIATGYEFSDDQKRLTIKFRKGLKWSDGEPFTADDVMFWWQIKTNKEITPTMPTEWMPGGEPMKVTKVDDFTVQYDFAIASSTIIFYFCQWANRGMQWQVFLPKHALEKYLLENNPDIEAEAKAAGFDTWANYFLDLATFYRDTPQKLNIPYMGPWIPSEITNDYVVWKRNPYYFKVDTEGQQLPYMDTYKGIFYKDADNLKLRALAGDFDYLPFGLSVADQTVLAENAEQGDYHIIQTPGVYGADCGIFVNSSYAGEPDEAAILADKRFRQALSVSIDREEVNTIVARGLAVVTQATVDPSSKWFRPEYATAYAQFDTDLANQLLDEMGMDKRDGDGFRLMPNGKPFTLTPEFSQTPAAVSQTAELIKDYWDKVGIRTNMRIVEYATMGDRMSAGEVMVFAYPMDGIDAVGTRLDNGSIAGFRPGWNMPLWYRWVVTDGEEGVEPPDSKIKQYIQNTLSKGSYSDEEFDKIAKEILDYEAESVDTIGTFGYMPSPTLVKNGLGNVDAVTVFGFSHPADGTKSHRPEVFYWQDPEKRK